MTNQFIGHDLPPEAYDQQNVNLEGRVVLPFPHVFFTWHNGRADINNTGIATVGGWKTDKAETLVALNQMGGSVPESFMQETLFTRESKPYDVLTTKYLAYSLIGIREAWFPPKKENQKKSYGFQALIYAAGIDKQTRKFVPLFPAVLYGKGYNAGNNLKNALSKWRSITAPARAQFATNPQSGKVLSAWFFYGLIGSVFKQTDSPVRDLVGTGNDKSPVVVCQCYEPETIDKAFLDNAYIGGEVAAAKMQLKEQAQEWLHAWDKFKTDFNTPAQPVQPTGHPYRQAAQQPPPPDETINFDEIPF